MDISQRDRSNESTIRRGNFKRNAFLLAVLFIAAVVGILQVACTKPGAQVQQTSTPQSAQSAPKAGTLARVDSDAHQCPALMSTPGLPVIQPKGDHQVILSWKASAHDAKHSDAFGYCVYRGATGKNPSFFRVNFKPFVGTSCTDNQVLNGGKYVYKVRAVDIHNNPSDFSNVALAPIPNMKASKSTVSAPPLCRGGDNPQWDK